MDINLLLTVIFGLGVPVVTFLITYKKTIGARKEREKTAYKEIVSIIGKLVAHEKIRPNLEVLKGLIKSKAREHEVDLDLSSIPLIFEDTITKFVENEFISQDVKQNLIDKMLLLQKEILGVNEIQEVLGFKKIPKTETESLSILISTIIAILTALIGIYSIYNFISILIPAEKLMSISWMIGTAVLVVITLTAYFYFKQINEIKYKKRIKGLDESVEKETNVIRELRNMAEKDIDALRKNIEIISIVPAPEKPSSEVKEKLDEFSRRLELLEGLGVSLKPEDYNNRGNDLFYKGNYELALKAFETAIRLKPDFAETWYNKGAPLYMLSRFDEALKAYEKAIELKPDHAEAWNSKASVLMRINRFDEAFKAYDKAIELKPDYAGAWFNRACAFSIKGNKENILSNLKKAIEINQSYKEKAKKDKDFEKLWDDVDFKTLVD